MEQWLAIPGFEGYYEVSDQGRVRSVRRAVVSHSDSRTRIFKGRVLSPELRNGYHVVHLSREGVTSKHYVHRLVLTAFIGEPEDGAECCHNNDVRTDNRLENLRWDSHLENVADCHQHGRYRNPNIGNSHCRRGHPFDKANTILSPEGRRCRECRRIRERARYEQRKFAG